jgi:predicted nucleic acid-binding protein
MRRRAVPASTATPVLADTGLLFALHAANDPFNTLARRWVASFDGQLHTVGSVLAETAWQLPARHRAQVADLVRRGAVQVHSPDAAGYARMAQLLNKYADLDPDWADIELVWLAEATGIHRIATLDGADFGVYRLHGRQRFDIVWPPGAA